MPSAASRQHRPGAAGPGTSATKSQSRHCSPGRAGNSSARSAARRQPAARSRSTPLRRRGLLGLLALHLRRRRTSVPSCTSSAPPALGVGRQARRRRRGRPRAGRGRAGGWWATSTRRSARLAGLEVDHDHPAVGVELDPVGVAGELDLLAVGQVRRRANSLLGAEHGPRGRGGARRRKRSRAARRASTLAAGRPGGAELQPAPDRSTWAISSSTPPSSGVARRSTSLATRVGEGVHDRCRSPGDCVRRLVPAASRARNHCAGSRECVQGAGGEPAPAGPGRAAAAPPVARLGCPTRSPGRRVGDQQPARRPCSRPAGPAGGRRPAAQRRVASGSAAVRRSSATRPASDSGRAGPARDAPRGDAELGEEAGRLVAVVLGRLAPR